MINHTRTLLLNQLAATCTGYPYNEYIDPNFIPIRLTQELQHVRDVLFTTLDITTQLKTVKGFSNILHINLLNPYTLYFDPRITYNSGLDILNYDTVIVDVFGLQQKLEQLLLDYNILNTVFKPVVRGAIQDLYSIWSQSQEITLKLGAVLLAYTYQLENIRIK